MSIQGRLLEISIIGCRNLKDTEWLSKQDPYVILEYANNKFRTKTDTDGGRNPSFNEKYTLPLIEGLQEVNVQVWNSNTLTLDDFIGSGKIFLQKVLSAGYDDNSWPLSSRSGKKAGEIRIIMHYATPKDKQQVAPLTASPYHTPLCVAPSYPAMQSAASGQPGYPPVYSPYNLPGHVPYSAPCMHGPGEYPPAPQHGPPPPYANYPPQAYPPQTYPPQTYPSYTYPPQPGYGAPPGAYPPYKGGCSHH